MLDLKINAFSLSVAVIFLLNFAFCIDPIDEEVIENPYKIAEQKRADDSVCNFALKKTYMSIDFENVQEKPEPASKTAKQFCPNLFYSCCTDIEISSYFDATIINFNNLRSHYDKVTDKLAFIGEVDYEILVKHIKDKVNAEKHEGNCKKFQSFKEPEKVASYLVSNLGKTVIAIRRFVEMQIKFYSGFSCLLCDPLESRNISLDPVTQKLSITYDSSMCLYLFSNHKRYLNVLKYLVDLMKLAQAASCNFDSLPSFDDILRLKDEVFIPKISQLKKFQSFKSSETSDFLTPEAQKECATLVRYHEWAETYDIMSIVLYTKRILKTFRKRVIKDGKPQELSVEKLQFISNSYMSASVRATLFPLHTRKIKNSFSADDGSNMKFDDVDGINLFDLRAIIPAGRSLTYKGIVSG